MKLKPCPFCGNSNVYITRNCYGEYYVRCPACGTVVWGGDDEEILTERRAADVWNRRAIDV